MREYELIVIINPDMEDEQRNEVVNRVAGWLTSGDDETGKPVVNQWGQRQLAYPINKFKTGYYVLYNANMEPSKTHEVERNLYFAEDIVRYLLIRRDDNVKFDYKQPSSLRDYTNESGQIQPRRRNHISAKQQHDLAKAIKRARHLALMSFVVD